MWNWTTRLEYPTLTTKKRWPPLPAIPKQRVSEENYPRLTESIVRLDFGPSNHKFFADARGNRCRIIVQASIVNQERGLRNLADISVPLLFPRLIFHENSARAFGYSPLDVRRPRFTGAWNSKFRWGWSSPTRLANRTLVNRLSNWKS